MMTNMPGGATDVVDLWPEGAQDVFVNERREAICANPDPQVPERWMRNITRARITRFTAQTQSLGLSMLVVPGGAFHFVSIDNEAMRSRAPSPRGGLRPSF